MDDRQRAILSELRKANARLAEISDKLGLVHVAVMNADSSGEAESLEPWLRKILKALEAED